MQTNHNTTQSQSQPDLSLPVIVSSGRIINPNGVGGPLELRTLSDWQIWQVYNHAYGVIHASDGPARVEAFDVKRACAVELQLRFSFKRIAVRSAIDELV